MRDNFALKLRGQVIRIVADFCFVMVLIWLLSIAESFHHGRSFFELSLSIAAMVALDLAFLRHLRRAYSLPQRSMWGGN